ncbi:MAG TPA: zinc-binding dehydrogenase [Nitrososphaerales archaeon]|nr:zinc-binding dehydrogenase [Nitrososphaerales archaeon]
MRAAVLRRVGEPLVLEEIKRPEPKVGEVLVKVSACGVCHSDLHVIKGELPFPLPAVLGHEVSGVVEETGPGVQGLNKGDAVVCSFIIHCGSCYYCKKGLEDLCENFVWNRQKGTLLDGTTRLFRKNGEPISMYSMAGLAEYAVVPRQDVFSLPTGISTAEACILGCAMFTAYGAAKNQANLREGESVAVIAVGGVGSSLVQISKALGAGRIIAVDIKDDKLEAARSLGATDSVNSTKEDVVKKILELTEGRGVDVAFEALGRAETMSCAVNSVRAGGRAVAIGLPIAPGASFPIEIGRLVRREVKLMGSYGARPSTDMPALIKLVEGGEVSMRNEITRRYTLDRAQEAWDALGRGEVIGRSIIEF